MTQHIGDNVNIQRNLTIISSVIDQDTVMMSIENGEYYGVNPIGSRIWELLEQPRTINVLCAILLKEYDVDADQCHRDVTDFINKLLVKGLLKQVESKA